MALARTANPQKLKVMKQIEFETRLAELQAEYLEKKSSIELAINDLKVEIENLRKELDGKLCEHKVAILNHQSSLSAMKADLESRRAALFVEFEKTGGQE